MQAHRPTEPRAIFKLLADPRATAFQASPSSPPSPLSLLTLLLLLPPLLHLLLGPRALQLCGGQQTPRHVFRHHRSDPAPPMFC